MDISEYQFSPSGKARALTDEQEREIAVRYVAGEGAPRLGVEFGCSHKTIYRSLERQGIPSRKPSERPRNGFVVDGYVWSPVDFNNPIDTAMMTREYPYLARHRQVMANSIGRPLTSDEQVHHIDGDRSNNDISNLQLRQGAHGSGVVMTCGDCGSHNVIATKIGN